MVLIDIQRTFHPVGQGAFYTEVFTGNNGKHFVMVYDCGTSTGKDEMEVDLDSQIEAFKKSLEPYCQIDALFLSHFHVDHISGLGKLLENINVRYTIIPMLTLLALTVCRVENFIKYDADKALSAEKVIQELFLSKDQSDIFGKVLVVAYDEDRPREEKVGKVDHPQRLGNGEVIPNGKKWEAFPFWEYIPFNSIKANDQRAIDFMDGLKQIPEAWNGDELNVNRLIRGCRTKVKDLYKKVMNNENDNLYTLVVESRPASGVFPVPDVRQSRCLYMGDFDWKGYSGLWCRFNGVYSLNEIGTIQVPHHGSKENWHDDLLTGKERLYVISAGTTNTYHHPNYWVVNSMWENGHGVMVVSEKMKSKGELHYFVAI